MMMDHATASSDASTRRRIATIALLLLASPRTADSSQPTAVWIPAQPISAPSRENDARSPAPNPLSRPCSSSSVHLTSPPMKIWVINVAR